MAAALGLGFVAGLRALTAPMVMAWAAHLGWVDLSHSPLSFMGATITVIIFSLLALLELIGDLLPSTPKRTAPAPLTARILMGGLCGGVRFRGRQSIVDNRRASSARSVE